MTNIQMLKRAYALEAQAMRLPVGHTLKGELAKEADDLFRKALTAA